MYHAPGPGNNQCKTAKPGNTRAALGIRHIRGIIIDYACLLYCVLKSITADVTQSILYNIMGVQSTNPPAAGRVAIFTRYHRPHAIGKPILSGFLVLLTWIPMINHFPGCYMDRS